MCAMCIINVAQNCAHKGAHLEGQECSFVKKGTVAYIFRYIFAPDIFQLFTSYKMDYIFQQHQVSLLCIKSSAAHPAGYPVPGRMEILNYVLRDARHQLHTDLSSSTSFIRAWIPFPLYSILQKLKPSFSKHSFLFVLFLIHKAGTLNISQTYKNFVNACFWREKTRKKQ